MRPEWQPIWLRCTGCRHDWDDWQPTHVPADTWIAHIGTLHCPQCGAEKGRLLIRSTPLNEPAG